MFSLPDIVRMNAEAASATARKAILRAVHKHLDSQGNPIYCDDSGNEAEEVSPWFDIFSDDAEGVVALCQEHYDSYGPTTEGYFWCEGCQRLMAENYTWELYFVNTDSGQYCLNCYRENELLNPDNWIPLTEKEIAGVGFERVRHVKHLIAVGQGVPKDLKFRGNVEFDSMTGGRIRSSSTADDTADAGVQEIRDLLNQAREDGYKRAIVILDARYQFAVSIGIYVPAEARGVTMSYTFRGHIMAFHGSWLSGLAVLEVMLANGEARPIYYENAPTVRALDACFGGVIRPHHTAAIPAELRQREVVLSVDLQFQLRQDTSTLRPHDFGIIDGGQFLRTVKLAKVPRRKDMDSSRQIVFHSWLKRIRKRTIGTQTKGKPPK